MQTVFPKAESITHQHILTCINTLLINDKNFRSGDCIRILDAGCGNGRLIRYLQVSLPMLHPDKVFAIHGFDVVDHGVQKLGFIQQTVKMLSSSHIDTDIDWQKRIHAFSQDENWNFGSEKFNFIVSNQVLEHVANKDKFFHNVHENLENGGYSIHLAPLSHIIWEGHIFLPWAHKFRSFSALYGYIRLMSRLGFGKFRQQRNRDIPIDTDRDVYSQRHADYIFFLTSYSSEAESLDVCRRNNLRADFRFSLEFFTSKARQLIGLHPNFVYAFREAGFFDSISIKFLRYLSSVTLVCKKHNTYYSNCRSDLP